MTTDLDIYRTANVPVREHGDEADLVPAERADSFLEAGDMAGSVVWKQVLKAIKETGGSAMGGFWPTKPNPFTDVSTDLGDSYLDHLCRLTTLRTTNVRFSIKFVRLELRSGR